MDRIAVVGDEREARVLSIPTLLENSRDQIALPFEVSNAGGLALTGDRADLDADHQHAGHVSVPFRVRSLRAARRR